MDEQLRYITAEAEKGDWLMKEALARLLVARAISRLDTTLLDQADYWYWKDKKRPETLDIEGPTWAGDMIRLKKYIEEKNRR